MTPKPSLLCNGTTIHSHIQAQILEIILKVSFSSSLLPMTYGHIVSIQTSGCLSNPSMSPYSSLVCATIILHTNNFNNITTSSPTYVSFNPFFIKQLSFYNTYLLQLIHSLNSPQFLFNILQKKKKNELLTEPYVIRSQSIPPTCTSHFFVLIMLATLCYYVEVLLYRVCVS